MTSAEQWRLIVLVAILYPVVAPVMMALGLFRYDRHPLNADGIGPAVAP